MITASEVLAQLTELLADVELVRADADKWRQFVALAETRGYGPRLTPGLTAALLPDGNQVAAVVADSRGEVGGAPASKSGENGKVKRRIITDDDRRAIRNAAAEGLKVGEIVERLGYSQSTVTRTLADVAGGAA